MEDAQNKGIMIAVGLIVTMLVAGLIFAIWHTASSTANKAQTQVTGLSTTLDESQYTEYEDQTIVGSQVVTLLSKYSSDDVCVKVVTKTNTATYNYTDTTLGTKSTVKASSANVKTNSNYVNPNGKFTCTIERDANNVIVGVTFTQQ